jgi:outer membrane protein assembly factor BamB
MNTTTPTIRCALAASGCLLAILPHAAIMAGEPPTENERLLWHVEFAVPQAGAHTGIASDGTIYATDSTALYAVDPDGIPLWTLPGAGGGRPIDVAGNGVIYTGNGNMLFAVNPDGSLLWSFTLPDSLVAGPSLGPDGNIYGSTDNSSNNPQQGKGAFSLDPTPPNPSLLWTNIGDPSIFSLPGSNLPVIFTDGRAIIGITSTAPGGAGIWAFEFDGDQDWFGGDLSPTVFGKPTTDSLGRVLTSGGQSIIATEADGDPAWQTQVPSGVSNLLPPVADDNSNVYTADTVGGELWALNPDGTTRYFVAGDGGIVNKISVAPDGSVLLIAGNNFGQPGFVRAYDAQDGSPLWQVTLDPQGGSNEFVHSLLFSFSPTNNTAYFTTRVGNFDANGRLYALRLHDEVVVGDLDGDGVVDVLDLLILLDSWGACPGKGQPCPADFNGDGSVDVLDLLILLDNWG